MTVSQPEPVEISTRMRPGEWNDESLADLVAGYRHKLLEMGAAEADIRVTTLEDDHGGMSVTAAWIKDSI